MQSVRQILHKYVFAKPENPDRSHIMRFDDKSNRLIGRGVPDDALDPCLLRKTALLEPLILKGIRKKNKDIFREWFELKPIDDGSRVSSRIRNLIFDFEVRTNIKYKMQIGGICSNIYGDGFIERTFFEESTPNWVEPNPMAKPLGLVVLNPECIKRSLMPRDDKSKQLYYVYEDKKSSIEPVFIHPKRIIHIKEDWLPNSAFGLSKVYTAQKILQSKMNADEALGEIISWFGHGILDMTVENMTDEQMKNMVKIFNTHPDYYVHDQDYELDVKNPSQFNPKEFFNVFNSNIAAAAEMPTHILTGESIGNVTGSEVNVSDYYNDIANIQEIVFTPILISVYKQLLESNNIRWKYKIDWNPVFVDELSEAKIYQTRAYAASQLFNAGIIDIKEARFIMNEGFTVLDVGKDIKKKDVDGSVVDQPNVAPQPVVKPKSFKVPLTAEQCEMIAKAEHELGLRELYEQDKRLDEAKKRLKNAK